MSLIVLNVRLLFQDMLSNCESILQRTRTFAGEIPHSDLSYLAWTLKAWREMFSGNMLSFCLFESSLGHGKATVHALSLSHTKDLIWLGSEG